MTDNIYEPMVESIEPRPDTRGHVKTAGILFLRSPCRNSLECSIMALEATDPNLQTEAVFVEDEDVPAPLPPEDWELLEARSNLARAYLEHRQIERELGEHAADT